MATMTIEERKTAITVKVVTMGKGVTNFMREEPLTLGTLLHELGVNGQMDVRVNGATMEKDHRLADGDQVLVVPRIRGGRV
jgi:sulfur carrier protein ThiS